ncbi:MAG: 3-hydroxyisobutyrate dehydrogenase [Geminicoccaceae bacterium]|jgi:3-hydroxyisobutyrate dehydrogenase|nr:3-hydroxyisobutyrate dehydrogenase [Geminicoccaceae bacterium]
MARIGFLGLGNMGLPMASNLRRAGHAVTGFDPGDPARRAAGEAGLRLADDLAGAVVGAEVVISMLPAGPHVRDAYEGPAGVLTHAMPQALLIDCSTIDVETARAVARAAAARGHDMVDAPVSGGVTGAAAASLTFMVGGTVEAFGRAAPFLEAMGQTIVHAGDAGTGQAAKICNNLMLGIQMISVCEAMVLAEKLGLAHQKLFDISSRSSGQCWSLTSYCPVPGPVPTTPANRDYRPGFTAAMMLKDLKLAMGAAEMTGAATPMGAAATQLYAKFAREENEGLDFSAIIKMIRGTPG